MKLYTYYRSQASFRVRIALNLKGIARGGQLPASRKRVISSPPRTGRSIRRWWFRP